MGRKSIPAFIVCWCWIAAADGDMTASDGPSRSSFQLEFADTFAGGGAGSSEPGFSLHTNRSGWRAGDFSLETAQALNPPLRSPGMRLTLIHWGLFDDVTVPGVDTTSTDLDEDYDYPDDEEDYWGPGPGDRPVAPAPGSAMLGVVGLLFLGSRRRRT